MFYCACSEVDHDITEEDGVGDHVEDDPACGEIIVEEGDGDGEDDQVGDQQQQHADVPVEPELRTWVDHPGARHLEKMPVSFRKFACSEENDSHHPLDLVCFLDLQPGGPKQLCRQSKRKTLFGQNYVH